MKRTPLKVDAEKVREWRDRSRRNLPRRTPMKRFNTKNRLTRFKRAYLSPAYVAFIRWTGCVVRGCEYGTIHACHRKSRGAGGTWQDLFGACAIHHAQQHDIGVREFERRHGLDLEAVCARNVMEWKASTKPDESRGTRKSPT